jgi:hypothetical protein
MLEGAPSPVAKQDPRLSEWPVYPGGGIAGALLAVSSVVIFVADVPALRDCLPVARALLVLLWALRICRSGD